MGHVWPTGQDRVYDFSACHFSVPGFGCYGSTKHAMQAIAEAMAQELQLFNIKIQTINPGAYATGYNETMAETAFKWMDDTRNFIKRSDMKAAFQKIFDMERDPEEVIEQLVKIVPSDVGQFRNIIPQFQEKSVTKGAIYCSRSNLDLIRHGGIRANSLRRDNYSRVAGQTHKRKELAPPTCRHRCACSNVTSKSLHSLWRVRPNIWI